MTPQKRCLDVALAAILGVLLSPAIALIALVVLLRDGRPILFASERMGTVAEPFTLWKFRTMRRARDDAGVTGADKTDRITATGRWLRAKRLDELPQLFNILRGDLSFVGPRPPLRLYVEAAPELYGEVLRARPGLTGLATLIYHRSEARILADCATPAETHATYLRRCVPAKAKLDLLYLKNRCLKLDLWILWQTIRRVLRN